VPAAGDVVTTPGEVGTTPGEVTTAGDVGTTGGDVLTTTLGLVVGFGVAFENGKVCATAAMTR
jgi:hypothetical protein